MNIPIDLHTTTQQLAAELQRRGWMLATAESCTGGMIAAACTDLPGSSAWFDRGFVTYSNAAKTEMLGVPAELIAAHGAVSEEVVRAMAQGALTYSQAHVSLATTGIAGPTGGSFSKPVGSVWIGWSVNGFACSRLLQLRGQRDDVRKSATVTALQALLKTLQTREFHV